MRSYLLKDPGFMNQMGVNMNQPIADRRKDAIQSFSRMMLNSIDTKSEYSKTKEMDAGYTEEQEVFSFDVWRRRIGSSNKTVTDEAANYLFGKSVLGKVSSAQVIPEKEVIPWFTGNGFPWEAEADKYKYDIPPMLEITYENAKQADAYKEKSLKMMADGGLNELSEPLDKFYNSKQGGKTVLIPIIPETEQILKELHRVSADEKGLYVEETDGDFMGFESKTSTKTIKH
jgi:hypothetical protein